MNGKPAVLSVRRSAPEVEGLHSIVNCAKDKPGYVRSANCFWYAASFRNNNLGFRLVRTLP